MAKEKKMPKEYAIIVSLAIFFSVVTIVGSFRLYLLTKTETTALDLNNIDVVETDTNIDMASYNLRITNAIRQKYDIDIYYGDEINVQSVNAVPLTDENEIFNMLREVNEVLEEYPQDLIREMEQKGYEISIYLVSYFTTEAEALANRNSIGQMKIYISNTINVKRALHHEYYHILDYYIRLETDERLAYLNWDKYNPKGFEYTEDINNITSKYVYEGEPDAYFVTPYAKFSEKEDRAETFAEMLTASKMESFFEQGPIKGKIDIIKKVLFNTFNCVRTSKTLAWQ